MASDTAFSAHSWCRETLSCWRPATECHRAGIRVKMITGDHAGTATAIGRQMGIIDDRDGFSDSI